MAAEVRTKLVLDPNINQNLSRARELAKAIQQEFNRAFSGGGGADSRIQSEIRAIRQLNDEVVSASRIRRQAARDDGVAERRRATEVLQAQRQINSVLQQQINLERQIVRQQGRIAKTREIVEQSRALTQLIQVEQREATTALAAAKTTDDRARAALRLEEVNGRLAQSGIRLQRDTDRLIREEVRLVEIQDKLAQSQLKGANAAKVLAQGEEAAAVATLQLDRAQEEAVDSSKRLDNAIQQEANSMRLSGQRIGALNTDLQNSRQQKQLLQQELRGTTQSFGSFGSVLGVVKSGLAALGIVSITREIVRLAVEVQKTGIAFETAFVGVIKTVDGVTDSVGELTSLGVRLRSDLLAIGREVPVSFQEINKIASLGGQLGVDPAIIPQFTDLIARLDVSIESLDAEQIAIQFAQLANILDLSQDDLERFSSSIVDLGNNTATTEDRIVNFARRIAGAADLANLSAPEIAGISAAFAAAGVEAEAGGTAVQRALLEMVTAVAEGGPKLEEFAAVVGLTGEQFREQFRAEGGSAQLFVQFVEALGTQGDRAVITLDNLGLANVRSVRSFLNLASAGDLLRTSVDRANQAFDENVALLNESNLRFATAESKIQLLINAWDRLKITFSDTEVIGAAAEGLTGFLDDVSNRLEAISRQRELINRFNEEAGGRPFILGGGVSSGQAIFQGRTPVDLQDPSQSALLDPEIQLRVEAFFRLIENGSVEATDDVETLTRAIDQLIEGFSSLEAIDIFDRLIAGQVELTEAQLRELSNKLASGEISLDALTPEFRKLVEGEVLTPLRFEPGLTSDQAAAVGELNDELLIQAGVLQEVNRQVELSEEDTEALVEGNRRLSEQTSASTQAIVDFAAEVLDADDATTQWVKGLVDAAVEAGATSDQLVELLATTGLLTEEELQGAAAHALYAAKQVEVFQAVKDGSLSYSAAARTLAAYRRELGLTAIQAAAFAAAQRQVFGSTFVSELQSALSASGGSGGAAAPEEELDPFAEFTDDFLANIRRIREDGLDKFNEDLAESEDGIGALANSLLDLSQGSGATIGQLQELAVALGAATPEEAAAAFQRIVGQQALQQLAEGFVDGKISAEQAAAAVQLMNQQLAEGQDIDLSSLGINLDSLARVAESTASAAGGAAEKTVTWRDSIIGLLDPAETFASRFLEVSRATGLYNDDINRAAFLSGAMAAAIEGLSGSAQDLDFEEAIGQLEEYERLLQSVTSVDELALIIDLQTELGRTPEDIIESFAIAAEKGISVPVAIQFQFAEEAKKQALSEFGQQISQGFNSALLQGGVDIGKAAFDEAITEAQNVANAIPLSADATELLNDIELITGEPRILPLEGDTDELEENILDVTEDADPYEVHLEADADQLTEQIQTALDQAAFTVDVDVNTNTPDSSNGSSGHPVRPTPRNIPTLQKGGLVQGPLHGQGGILAEFEGGEYFVSRDKLSPALYSLLEAVKNSNQPTNDVLTNFIRNPASIGEQTIPNSRISTPEPQAFAAAVPPSLIETVARANFAQPVGFAPPNIDSSISHSITQSSQRSTTNNYFYGNNGSGAARPVNDLAMRR